MRYSPEMIVDTTGAAPPRDTSGNGFVDADTFCASARRHQLFVPGEGVVVARAPGRFDVFGGIADYAGGLVLGFPIGRAVLAAAQVTADGQVVAISGRRRLAIPAAELIEAPLDDLAARFAGKDSWGAYVLGPVALLAREERLAISGLRLVVSSSVPEGKGLGSSAAVEIAVAQATAGAFGHLLEPRRLAMLGHRAEQLVARAPCGSMDQMTATFGEEAQILALMCRPAEIVGSFALPEGVTLWGIDSGARHAVRDAPYRRARCATFMGKALLGVEADYLTALRPEDIEAEQLPERMTGTEFLRLRDGVEDELSRVEPAVEYPVRAATLHPVEEQVRVETFLRALEEPLTRRRSRMLGDLMAASHDGYSRCGLGTSATDHIVEAVRDAGWERGLVGARVSGGGCGGTVVVLGREEAEPVVRRIAKTLGVGIVVGTSAGATSFGIRVV